ncbi:mechanosensitive ion channel family protein [Modestobacter sp. SYSU DS0875]
MDAFVDVGNWLRSAGLEALLIVLGAVLLARFVSWAGARITDRIDATARESDALVRSEAAKHRHSLTQVITWAAIVLIWSIAVFFVLERLGVPITGLVAPATVLGVGLGFGAQRVVGDVLAGFFIITERQYGFGDSVSIVTLGGQGDAYGTVEDVTLRITRLRSPDGEVISVPNGQIIRAINHSRDWARAVVDIPVPTDTDVSQVQEVLREVGRRAYADPRLHRLLLDEPTVMGVESITLDEVNLRMVARTLPGKQFEVGRDLRARVALALSREGVSLRATTTTDLPSVQDEALAEDRARGGGAA